MTTAPWVGDPLAFGVGAIVLVAYAFAKSWTESLVTVAHEGGHMATLALTGRGHRGFTLEEGKDYEGNAATDGATRPIDSSFGVTWWLCVFSGYATPPLAGLAGAHALADGNGWGVLWAGIVLLTVALLWANNGFARAVTALGLAIVLWVAIAGGPRTQAATAFALVWLLLIGGVAQAIGHRGGSDGQKMASSTWIPSFVWWAAWSAIALLCLWSGGRLLLHHA
jgi:Peptidase M50B-like